MLIINFDFTPKKKEWFYDNHIIYTIFQEYFLSNGLDAREIVDDTNLSFGDEKNMLNMGKVGIVTYIFNYAYYFCLLYFELRSHNANTNEELTVYPFYPKKGTGKTYATWISFICLMKIYLNQNPEENDELFIKICKTVFEDDESWNKHVDNIIAIANEYKNDLETLLIKKDCPPSPKTLSIAKVSNWSNKEIEYIISSFDSYEDKSDIIDLYACHKVIIPMNKFSTKTKHSLYVQFLKERINKEFGKETYDLERLEAIKFDYDYHSHYPLEIQELMVSNLHSINENLYKGNSKDQLEAIQKWRTLYKIIEPYEFQIYYDADGLPVCYISYNKHYDTILVENIIAMKNVCDSYHNIVEPYYKIYENKEEQEANNDKSMINLTKDQIIYLVHKSGIPKNENNTAVTWAALLHILTGKSFNTLRRDFYTANTNIKNNLSQEKITQVDILWKEILSKVKN